MNSIAMTKWLEISRFELTFQLRRWSTWVFFALFLLPLMGQANSQAIQARAAEMLFTSPLLIAKSCATMSMLALLIMAAVAGDAATRDIQTRLEPLMHAAPIGRAAYLGGRFFGAFMVMALYLVVIPVALMIAPLLRSDIGPELLGPFTLVPYLQAYFLLILPNTFVAMALLFAVATLVRHIMGSYLGAAMLFAATLLSTMYIGVVLGQWELAKLINPLGHASLELLGRSWSPGDLNTRLVGLDGGLLWNRLLWLGVGLAVLAFAYTRFRYEDGKARRWWPLGRKAWTKDLADSVRNAPLVIPSAPREYGTVGRVRQTLSIVRDSMREIFTGWSWLALPYMAMQITGGQQMLVARGQPILPTTGRILSGFGDIPSPMLAGVFALIVLFAGELVWRERDANLEGLADASPVPDGLRFVGKLLALWVFIVAAMALLALSGIIIQVSRGWYDFDPALYLKVLFGLDMIGPLVFALFALSVHVLVNQKHVGHVVVVVLVLVVGGLTKQLGFEHPLLLPFSGRGWIYSPLRGFEPFTEPLLWFALYWAGWTLLIATVARLFWVRGVKQGIAERVRIARQRFTGRMVAAAMGVVGLIVLTGAFVFYNTNILNAYQPVTEGPRRQIEYERRYRRYEDVPQPQIATTKLEIEIYPGRHEADVRGVYQLVNRTPRPIDTIHVAISSEVETKEVAFGQTARAALIDEEMGHRIYQLEQPLPPGDSLSMTWHVRYYKPGFPARGTNTAVVANGSFIELHGWRPLIGYQSYREISGAVERREQGLAFRRDVAALDDVPARSRQNGQEPGLLDITVGTAAGQTAIAPGELNRTWESDGRQYFHYVTNEPVGPGYAIFSADYAVGKARAGDIALEVVHHPPHDLNVERMLRSMQRSLAQFTTRFGPFRPSVLRLVEYTGDGGGSLHATLGTIWYQELFSLFDTEHDTRKIDLPFAVVSHEVAHQFQPITAAVEGRALLSESFAWYAALSVIEEEYGTEHLGRFLDFMRRDYLDPRARASVPLLRASDYFLGYRKGPFAMYALREYMGQEKVDLAWRRLRALHASSEPPFATSLDLLRELRKVTPDSLQTLLGDLLERNTFWELETRQATAQEIAGGAWQVGIEVVSRKVAVDTAGTETNLPMNDLVEIGVYALDAEGGKQLHLAKHFIRTGSQTITVTVPGKPGRAGIDPRHLLIDVDMDNNIKDVTTKGRE